VLFVGEDVLTEQECLVLAAAHHLCINLLEHGAGKHQHTVLLQYWWGPRPRCNYDVKEPMIFGNDVSHFISVSVVPTWTLLGCRVWWRSDSNMLLVPA
jgi:hypothetical protein